MKYNKKNKEELLIQTQKKLKALDLLYEFNRLQFAVISYSIINKLKKKYINVDQAANIVLPFFDQCIIEAKQYLNFEQLNIIYGYSVMRLFEIINNK